jgi:hypothetical protein
VAVRAARVRTPSASWGNELAAVVVAMAVTVAPLPRAATVAVVDSYVPSKTHAGADDALSILASVRGVESSLNRTAGTTDRYATQ